MGGPSTQQVLREGQQFLEDGKGRQTTPAQGSARARAADCFPVLCPRQASHTS